MRYAEEYFASRRPKCARLQAQNFSERRSLREVIPWRVFYAAATANLPPGGRGSGGPSGLLRALAVDQEEGLRRRHLVLRLLLQPLLALDFGCVQIDVLLLRKAGVLVL